MSRPVACTVIDFDGVTYWRDGGGTGQVLARREGDVVEDCRPDPPFVQILPCPYCDVAEDREHDPLKHVNPNLGWKT